MISKKGKGKVTVLIDKTILEYGYNPSLLNEGSHNRIYVHCVRCGEDFLRERRHVHKLHACPTHKNLDNVDYKWCNSCNKFIVCSKFNKNAARVDGYSPYCKECTRIKCNVNPTPCMLRKREKVKTLEGWMKILFLNKRNDCKKHGVTFNLTYEFLMDTWNFQGGKCFYSGIPLEFGKHSLKSATLERLDSDVGYIKTNMVWASRAMNHMKNDATYSEFREFLADMNIYHNSSPRCEYKSLDDESKIPSRAKTFDAGMDVYATHDITLSPGKFTEIKTGMALSAHDGYYFTIEGRSSLFKYGIEPVRGIIDASYTGEITVVLFNVSSVPYDIKKGDRVAQLIMHRVYVPDIVVVDNFSIDHRNRGDAGYGSTGK